MQSVWGIDSNVYSMSVFSLIPYPSDFSRFSNLLIILWIVHGEIPQFLEIPCWEMLFLNWTWTIGIQLFTKWQICNHVNGWDIHGCSFHTDLWYYHLLPITVTVNLRNVSNMFFDHSTALSVFCLCHSLFETCY